MKWVCFFLVSILVGLFSGCGAENEDQNEVVFRVVPSLAEDFSDYLSNKSISFSYMNSDFSVQVGESPIATSFSILDDFYYQQGVDFSKVVTMTNNDNSVVYCCVLDDNLLEYLTLYNGETFLSGLRQSLSQKIEQDKSKFLRADCEVDVLLENGSIRVLVRRGLNKDERERFLKFMGVTASDYPFAVIRLVTSSYKSSILVNKYLNENMVVEFEN